MNTKNQHPHSELKDTVEAVCDTVELHYRDLHRCMIAVAATGGDAMSTMSGTRPVGFLTGKLRAESAQEKVHAIAEMQANACGLLCAVLKLCDGLADSGGCELGAKLSECFVAACAEKASKGVKRFRVVAVDGEEKEAAA